MLSNHIKFDATTYDKPLSMMGICLMRDVNPLEYVVERLSKPYSGPVELPRPPTDSNM